jgi:hypothetical protein
MANNPHLWFRLLKSRRRPVRTALESLEMEKQPRQLRISVNVFHNIIRCHLAKSDN